MGDYSCVYQSSLNRHVANAAKLRGTTIKVGARERFLPEISCELVQHNDCTLSNLFWLFLFPLQLKHSYGGNVRPASKENLCHAKIAG